MANMTTSIVMQLVDRVTSPVRRITQSLRGISARAGLSRLGQQAQQVGSRLGVVTREALALGRRLGTLGAVIGAGSLFGLARMVPAMTKASDEIRLSAQRLGVGTTALQEWMYVARQFGVDNGMLVRSMQTLQVNTDEFIMTAKGPAADAFKRLGIDYKQIRQTKGNADKLFALVADHLRNVKNSAERQNIAQALFGGGGRQLAGMVAASKKEIEEMKATAHEVGAVLTDEQIAQAKEYNDGMDDLGLRLAGIRDTIVGGLLPAINEWVKRLNDWVSANRALIATRVEAWLRTVWGAAQAVGAGVRYAADMVGGFGNLALWLAGFVAIRLVIALGLAVASTIKLGWALIVTAGRGVMFLGSGLLGLTKSLLGLAARAIPAVIAGIRAVSVAFLTTPIGWIVGGIALVAGAAYLIYKNWDGVSAWFSAMWERIKAFFSQGPVEVAKQLLAFSPAGLIYTHWDGITQWASGLWSDVKKVFSEGIDGVFGVFETKSLVDTGTKWVGGLWDGIKSRWDQLTAWLRNKVDELTGWMPDWARDKLGLGSMQMPQASGSPEARLGAPVANANTPVAAAVAQRSRVDVGGRLKIQVDSEGRARVKEARSSGGLGFDVDSGVLGVAG